MIKTLIGDLFASDAQTLVNTVNCVGVMGKGIALEFKKRFPEMHRDYVALCRAKKVRLGEPYIFKSIGGPWILNFPTKDHWRSVSQLEDIVSGLEFLERHYRGWGVESLAVPPLGCGHGQLEWKVVGPTLYRHLSHMQVPVELYAPFGTKNAELQAEFLQGGSQVVESTHRIGAAWIALVEVLHRIESEPYHWPVGRTAFQKLVYFATEMGLPTGLRFERGDFGPYSKDLKRRVTALVNNGLVAEERLGRMFAIRVGPTYADAQRAYETSIHQYDSDLDKIADLFLRMNTQQAETAATVHFSAKTRPESGLRPTECDVLDYVTQWKGDRSTFKRSDVAAAIRNLNVMGWINAAPSDSLPV